MADTAGARQGGGISSARPADSATARLAYLTNSALPGALDTLASRHESLGKVVSYLEANYLLAIHSKADKGAVEKEAHLYLNEALARVATDIDTAASNLEQYLSLECNAVHSLEQQVSLLQANLALAKDRSARARLATFFTHSSPPSLSSLGDATITGEEEEKKEDALKKEKKKKSVGMQQQQQRRKFNEHTISTRVLPMDSTNRRLSMPSYTHTNVKRQILSDRLSRLDHVGLHLNHDQEREPELPESPPPPAPTTARFSVAQHPAAPASSTTASVRSSPASVASSRRTPAPTFSAAASVSSVPVTPAAAAAPVFTSTVKKPPTKLTASTKMRP